MIPADMPQCLRDVIRRHGGEWMTWARTIDNESNVEYRATELQLVVTLGCPRSSQRAFVLVGIPEHPDLWEFHEESTSVSPSVVAAMRKPVEREMRDLAAMNRPSMCSEVNLRLLELAERMEAGR